MLFAGRIAYERLPDYLAALDVCLSTQTNDLAGQARTTGKLPLYLAAGRYILASRVGEAALVLPDDMLLDYHGVVDRDYPARLAGRVRESPRSSSGRRRRRPSSSGGTRRSWRSSRRFPRRSGPHSSSVPWMGTSAGSTTARFC